MNYFHKTFKAEAEAKQACNECKVRVMAAHGMATVAGSYLVLELPDNVTPESVGVKGTVSAGHVDDDDLLDQGAPFREDEEDDDD